MNITWERAGAAKNEIQYPASTFFLNKVGSYRTERNRMWPIGHMSDIVKPESLNLIAPKFSNPHVKSWVSLILVTVKSGLEGWLVGGYQGAWSFQIDWERVVWVRQVWYPNLVLEFFIFLVSLLRACPYMSTYRFGPSETRYLLCHNNIIIWRPRYLMYLYDIINGYEFHI